MNVTPYFKINKTMWWGACIFYISFPREHQLFWDVLCVGFLNKIGLLSKMFISLPKINMKLNTDTKNMANDFTVLLS